MSMVNDFHPEAIDLAEQAFIHKETGDVELANSLFSEAYKLEQAAAELLPLAKDSEPSRSVLFRSAATMAYHAGEYEVADRLVAMGISGYPPPAIKTELRELRQDIEFMISLKSRGIALSKSQWSMTIDGNAVRHGGAQVDSFMIRVDRLTKLVYRTVERLLGIEYRTSGGVSKDIKDEFGIFLKLVPGSFKVLFQLGAPAEQMYLLPEMEQEKKLPTSTIIDEVISCFEILESANPIELQNRIPDKNYFDNFIGLAKNIAPDGEDVKYVGFQAVVDGREETVVLRKNRSDLRKEIKAIKVKEKPSDVGEDFRVTGLLTFASTPKLRKHGTVKLIMSDSGKPQPIKVPIALMKDVVQPHYEEQVEIYGVILDSTYYLEEIAPLS